MRGNDLLQAMACVGADLVDEAEKRSFAKAPWRKWVSQAACLVILAGLFLGAYLLLRQAATVPPNPDLTQPEEANVIPDEPEYTPKEPEQRFLTLVFQNCIYYLQAPLTPLPDTPEQLCALGTIDEGQLLAGAACYYDEKYVSWARDGVPLEMYLEYEGEYYNASTYGELADKNVAYTYEEAQALTDEELFSTFVSCFEQQAPDEALTYSSEHTPSALEQIALFVGMLRMEQSAAKTSLAACADRWLPEGFDRSLDSSYREYEVPAAEIQEMMDQYFDGCKFDPRELDCYDPVTDTVHLDWQYMPYGYERSGFSTTLTRCEWDLHTQTVQLTALLSTTISIQIPEPNHLGSTCYEEVPVMLGEKVYCIQFTEDGPKYLSISQMKLGSKVDPFSYKGGLSCPGNTLYSTFVRPIERMAADETLTYTAGQSPSSEDQLAMCAGMLWTEFLLQKPHLSSWANDWNPRALDDRTGSSKRWECFAPAEDIQQVLDVYFDGCQFDPSELDCYDPAQDAVHLYQWLLPYGRTVNPLSTALTDFQWNYETQTVQLWIEVFRETATWKEGYGYETGKDVLAEKVYTIQFTDEGPKYLSIERIDVP